MKSNTQIGNEVLDASLQEHFNEQGKVGQVEIYGNSKRIDMKTVDKAANEGTKEVLKGLFQEELSFMKTKSKELKQAMIHNIDDPDISNKIMDYEFTDEDYISIIMDQLREG